MLVRGCRKIIVHVTPRYRFRVPVYAECISPDVFEGRGLEEISRLEVWEGNRRRALSGLFKIEIDRGGETEASGPVISLSGDFSKVRGIGAGMSKGKIVVEGDVGMHLGEGMRGGEIIVNGDADSWAGGSMRGGRIEIRGSAGDYIGAPYRGGGEGMSNGLIVIYGDAGREVGCSMRGGTIKVYGSVKHFVGVNMLDGTILVRGDCAGEAGAGMRNGRIIICGRIPSIIPTFTIDSIRPSVDVDGEKVTGPFYRFMGDIADNGEGKLFVSKAANPHLSHYEKYLQ